MALLVSLDAALGRDKELGWIGGVAYRPQDMEQLTWVLREASRRFEGAAVRMQPSTNFLDLAYRFCCLLPWMAWELPFA